MASRIRINGPQPASKIATEQSEPADIFDDLRNFSQSMDAQMQRCQEHWFDRALKGIYEAGRDNAILEQLIAKAREFGEITDATSYAAAGAILSEMRAVEERGQKREQEFDAE